MSAPMAWATTQAGRVGSWWGGLGNAGTAAPPACSDRGNGQYRQERRGGEGREGRPRRMTKRATVQMAGATTTRSGPAAEAETAATVGLDEVAEASAASAKAKVTETEETAAASGGLAAFTRAVGSCQFWPGRYRPDPRRDGRCLQRRRSGHAGWGGRGRARGLHHQEADLRYQQTAGRGLGRWRSTPSKSTLSGSSNSFRTSMGATSTDPQRAGPGSDRGGHHLAPGQGREACWPFGGRHHAVQTVRDLHGHRCPVQDRRIQPRPSSRRRRSRRQAALQPVHCRQPDLHQRATERG